MTLQRTLSVGLAAILGVTALIGSVSAQRGGRGGGEGAPAGEQPARRAPQALTIKVSQLRPNIYWASGGGGNSSFIIGSDGVIVFDAKSNAEGAKALIAEIAKITPKPITHVFVSHSDADHWGGLEAFPANATVIASEGFRKEQITYIAQGDAPNMRVPNKLVKQGKEAMTIQGIKMEAYHWVPGHTSGDLILFIPDQKIAFTGDVTSNARPEPTLHAHKGANPDGWIATVTKIVALPADQFVNGHGEADTFERSWLEMRLKSAIDINNQVIQLVKEGRSLGDIKMQTHWQAVGSGNPAYVEVAYWYALLKPRK